MSANRSTKPSTTVPSKLSYLTKLPSPTSPIDIDGSDVIKIIQQFLSEQGLHRSLRALQDETQLTTNTVDNPTKFHADIISGQWEAVLGQLHNFSLSTPILFPVYELILLELCEVGEFSTAQHVLDTLPLFQDKSTHSESPKLSAEHSMHLSALRRYVSQHVSDPLELYGTNPRQNRRQSISDQFKLILCPPSASATPTPAVPKNRLLHIISNALRYQQMVGLLPQHVTDYNLFTDALGSHSIEDQRPAVNIYHDIAYAETLPPEFASGDNTHVNVAIFTTNGKYLVTGDSYGVIQLWDCDSGSLAADLPYQQADNEHFSLMMHLHPITALAVSADGELLASGTSNGDIKVWSIYTGECLLTIRQAHDGASINSLQFSVDGLLLLSSSSASSGSAGNSGSREVKSWNLQSQAIVSTYNVDNPVAYCCYPSLNLQQLTSNTVLVLDTMGLLYLFTNGELVIKKQLMTMLSPKITGAFYDPMAIKVPENEGLMMSFDGDTVGGKPPHQLQLYTAQPIRIRPDVLLLSSRGDNALYTLHDQSGDILAMYTTAMNPNKTPGTQQQQKKILSPQELAVFNCDMSHTCTSALAKYIYATSADGGSSNNNVVFIFNFETKKIEKIFSPHKNNIILSICHHPYRNLLVTAGIDGRLKIWR